MRRHTSKKKRVPCSEGKRLYLWRQKCGELDRSIRSPGAWCRDAHGPGWEGRPSMTRTEILQAITKLTEDIRTLSYSSTKAAAAKILDLQQQRRELRAQLEATEP